MINPARVMVGDVLYDCHRQRMGNTTMSRMGCWQVRVLEVPQDPDAAHAQWLVSWNSNRPETYSYLRMRRLRRSPSK